MEGVQGGSETSNVVRVGDSGTDGKTGGGDGGGRVEDVMIYVRSDNQGSYSNKEMRFQYIPGWMELNFQDISGAVYHTYLIPCLI